MHISTKLTQHITQMDTQIGCLDRKKAIDTKKSIQIISTYAKKSWIDKKYYALFEITKKIDIKNKIIKLTDKLERKIRQAVLGTYIDGALFIGYLKTDR